MRMLSLLVLLALAIAPGTARADFYSMAGRFQCLDTPGAVCIDATVPRDSLLVAKAPPPKPAAAPAAMALEVTAPEPTKTALPAAKPLDPVLAVAGRIKLGTPAAGDTAVLRRAADAGDKRALELLAWCLLRGIGMPEDAMAAYALYGKAAAAGVPRAAQNQEIIFEQNLTSDERQSLLEMAAAATPARGLAAATDLPQIP